MTAGHLLRLLASAAVPEQRLTARQIIKLPAEARQMTSLDIASNLEKFQKKQELLGESFDQIFETVRAGMQILQDNHKDAKLDEVQIAAFSALLAVNNVRPSIQTAHLDKIDEQDYGYFASLIRDRRPELERCARSVGVINLRGRQFGSGFVAKDGFILTARHVAEMLVENESALKEGAQIEFPNGESFSLTDWIDEERASGPLSVGTDFDMLDCAVLGTTDSGPPPLHMSDSRADLVKGLDIALIGYPAPPAAGEERFSVLSRIFDLKFGVQRVAWGEVMDPPGSVDGDQADWVFSHDCTTLPGCSGAPIFDLGDPDLPVVGIHFSGMRRIANFAHSSAAVRSSFENLELNFR